MLKFELAGVTIELDKLEGDVKISGQPEMVEVIGDLIARQYGVRGHLVGGLWMSQADLIYVMASRDLQQYSPKSASEVLEKGARTGETKTVNGITYTLNQNSRWVRQKDNQATPAKPPGESSIESQNQIKEDVLVQQQIEAERQRKAEVLRARTEAMKDPRSYIDRGVSQLSSVVGLERDLEESDLADEYNKLDQEFNAIFDELEDFTAAYKTPTGQRLLEIQSELAKRKRESSAVRIAAMEGLRQQLMNRPDVDISRVDITSNATKNLGISEVKQTVSEFAKMTGGLGLSRIGKITYLEDRAYANQNGTLNIGINESPERAKAVLFHEMAHYIEYENPLIAQAALNWIKSRAAGPAAPLKELNPSGNYDDDELAYPGNFANPYIGKIYGEGSSSLATEVIAVGFEHFTDAKSMLELYDRDREHFAFMLGVLNRG